MVASEGLVTVSRTSTWVGVSAMARSQPWDPATTAVRISATCPSHDTHTWWSSARAAKRGGVGDSAEARPSRARSNTSTGAIGRVSLHLARCRASEVTMQTIPMSQPDVSEAERAAVDEVLKTSTLSLGPRLALFERKVAAYVGTRHAVGVSSGTAGLHLAMIAAGLGEGDLVVTSPFSFIASANCILYVGARPVFVDVDPRTLTLDPEAVERTVTALTR